MKKIQKESYIIQAYLNWITDNNHTPFINIDATHHNVIVPKKAFKISPTVLNWSTKG